MNDPSTSIVSHVAPTTGVPYVDIDKPLYTLEMPTAIGPSVNRVLNLSSAEYLENIATALPNGRIIMKAVYIEEPEFVNE